MEDLVIRKLILLMVLVAIAAAAPSPFKKITPHAEANQRPSQTNVEAAQTLPDEKQVKAQQEALAAQEAATKAAQPKPFDANDPSTWPKCPEHQWVWAQDGQCHDKPKETPAAPATAAVSGRVPVGVHDVGGSGDCAAEIAKYNWGQGTALAVARAESGLRPGIINNNPSTKDYSIGCFQINIYGANANSRPPQSELIKAHVNVAFAHRLYSGNGASFIGQWGVCSKVRCY